MNIIKVGICGDLPYLILKIGFDAVTKRHVGGLSFPINTEWFCGYVGVPPKSALYGVEWNDDKLIDVEVHGGVTFGGTLDLPDPRFRGVWWIGFDCNHYMDRGNPKDADYAEAECRSLAAQLSRLL